jgi:hypothetical protein
MLGPQAMPLIAELYMLWWKGKNYLVAVTQFETDVMDNQIQIIIRLQHLSKFGLAIWTI